MKSLPKPEKKLEELVQALPREIRAELFDIPLSWQRYDLNLTVTSRSEMNAEASIAAVAQAQSLAVQEKAKAEQELAKAEQEKAKAEQEKAKAKAEQEKAKATQLAAKAERANYMVAEPARQTTKRVLIGLVAVLVGIAAMVWAPHLDAKFIVFLIVGVFGSAEVVSAATTIFNARKSKGDD